MPLGGCRILYETVKVTCSNLASASEVCTSLGPGQFAFKLQDADMIKVADFWNYQKYYCVIKGISDSHVVQSITAAGITCSAGSDAQILSVCGSVQEC